MVTDAQRRELFNALVTGLGEGPAGTMMELLPPLDWADVARRSDLAMLGHQLRGEIADFRAEMGGEMGGLRGDMGELRGEMVALGARVDAQLSKVIAANAVTALAVASAAFAAGRLIGG